VSVLAERPFAFIERLHALSPGDGDAVQSGAGSDAVTGGVRVLNKDASV